MIFVILMLILLLATAAVIHFWDWDNLTWIPSGLVAFILFLCCAISDAVPQKDKLEDPFVSEIAQLKTSSQDETNGGGSFLGWSISQSETPQYIIMEKLEDGRMIRRFLNQYNTYIVETEKSPRVEFQSYKEYFPKWRSLPWRWDDTSYYHDFDNAVIYVPVGTVIVKFEEL